MSLERVCAVADIGEGEARRFDLGRVSVAIVRIGTDFYAIGDRCTHQDISLSEGEVHADSLELECWKHGSCFSLVDGAPSTLPATKATPTYTVAVDGDDLYVEID